MSVRAGDDGSRQVGIIAGLAAVLFLVLLAPFVRTVRQVQEPGARESLAAGMTTEAPGTGQPSDTPVEPSEPTMGGSAETQERIVEPVMGSPGADDGWTAYHDPVFRFSLEIPSLWVQATVERHGGEASADGDVLFEDLESGARLAISVWSEQEPTEFADWVADAAAGLEPVDGRQPVNAVIAGRDALVVWSPETPTYPAQYAAFLAGSENLYRVSYSASDGGAAMSVFIRALVSLSIDGTETLDTIPPVPMPDGDYFPNRRADG